MQVPEARDVMGRGESHIQEKCTGITTTLSVRGRREWHAMRHAADAKRLDQRHTVCVVPHPARVPPDGFLIRGTVRKPVHVSPLPNDVLAVDGLYDRIAGAMPNRDFRPWPAMSGRCAHAIAKRLRGMSVLSKHSLECLLNVAGAPIGQPCDDGAAGKNLRIRCKHSRSHGAAGREAGDEYFARVSSKCRNGVLDHLPDRKRLAVATRDVARQKPGETILRIVGGLLLRIDDRKAESVGEGRPAGTVIILVRSLGAAM